jgi:hypothetical protein
MAQPPVAQPPQPYQQQFGPPFGYPAAPRTNGMAVASLVCGLAGVLLSWFTFGIPSILAAVFGGVGLKQLRESETEASGKGMAIAGLVLGVLVLIPALLLIVFVGAAGIFGLGTSP